MKIISQAEGVPAISATGDPLPGEWYKVLTEDGTTGYCFSYRLKLFEHSGGTLAASAPDVYESASEPDPDLDMVLSKKWSPESYAAMIDYRRVNLDDLSHRWRFDPGQETGTARIFVSGLDQSFSYTAIRSDGLRAWRFEGTNLLMQLRTDKILAVQFTESQSGSMKTLLFVSLPTPVDDLIIQESARRDRLYNAIYNQGPVFTSNNYGTLNFSENKIFSWKGFDLLVPQFIPETAEGNGLVSMDLFLDSAFEDRYSGAFTMHFAINSAEEGGGAINGGEAAILRCMYALDNQGFRIEIAPESTIEDMTVVRRAPSPMVLYFYANMELW
jgi:predicted outer membrane repeat protein